MYKLYHIKIYQTLTHARNVDFIRGTELLENLNYIKIF